MKKLRLTETYYDLFHADTTPQIIQAPELSYIAINGKGPLFDNPEYDEAEKLIQGIAFFTKFRLKQDPPDGFFNYWLPPFQIIRTEADKKEKTSVSWKLLLLQPDYVTEEHVEKAYYLAKNKQEQTENIRLPRVRFFSVKPKKYIQVLHTTSYTAQKRTHNNLVKAAEKNGYELTGKKEEVHLKDPRKADKLGAEIIIRRGLKKKK